MPPSAGGETGWRQIRRPDAGLNRLVYQNRPCGPPPPPIPTRPDKQALPRLLSPPHFLPISAKIDRDGRRPGRCHSPSLAGMLLDSRDEDQQKKTAPEKGGAEAAGTPLPPLPFVPYPIGTEATGGSETVPPAPALLDQYVLGGAAGENHRIHRKLLKAEVGVEEREGEDKRATGRRYALLDLCERRLAPSTDEQLPLRRLAMSSVLQVSRSAWKRQLFPVYPSPCRDSDVPRNSKRGKKAATPGR